MYVHHLSLQRSSVKFHLETFEDNQNFALYTYIDNDPKQRAYLLPSKDTNVKEGPRQSVIRAIETPKEQEKYNFVFSASISENLCSMCHNKSEAVDSNSLESW